jgi:2-dehydropantoate 2-reductase
MRYVVYGAGAVGATIGARLHDAGKDVVLIARGAHLSALRRHGLRFRAGGDETRIPVPVAGSAAQLAVWSDDIVILAVKSQDTALALAEIAATATPDIGIVCAQNGVDNERAALRRCARVYGMMVMLPASMPGPGIVEVADIDNVGVLDVGSIPYGSDATCARVSSDLRAAGFTSRVVEDVMAWKYAKLIFNVENALEAIVGPDAAVGADVLERARAEARTVIAAANVACADEGELFRRASAIPRPASAGGSSWQSLARRTGRIEADYLNGEIALMGRLHRIPTPVNDVLQRLANQLARERRPPGSLTLADVERAVSSGGQLELASEVAK